MTAIYYGNNPLIHCDRRKSLAISAWQRRFCCQHIKPLIICRGPVRKEAMEIFAEMGIDNYGILLSEKDSIIYPQTLAPELRLLKSSQRVHHVQDYGGATAGERQQRVAEIIAIARQYNYCSVFAGYGFMAEDYQMVSAIQGAGLRFIGPGAATVARAGFKDEAKRIARQSEVSITPGIDNCAALALLKEYPQRRQLLALAEKHGLALPAQEKNNEQSDLEELAESILEAGYSLGVELYTIEQLSAEVRNRVKELLMRWPAQRLRLKAVGGGGGKGQRIIGANKKLSADELEKLLDTVPSAVSDILSEVKALSPADNRNILVELNIEQSRHMEIQVVGNGDWCVTMGGRDCSVQMHEQKLLEMSVTAENLALEVAAARDGGRNDEALALEREMQSLEQMETEAQRFGKAVQLDSVSTFECIVTPDHHYFMEMNTRIQVEHRISELCYGLQFINPAEPKDSFQVDSLIETMVLLAVHGSELPKPQRVRRQNSAVEVRLNATNDALMPHAGGTIDFWSRPINGEIRDDQGICVPNPDTGAFIRYRLAGSYDSNIALIINCGENRRDNLEKMSELLRLTELDGEDLATNLHFHRGLISWLLANNPNARLSTGFVQAWLCAVAGLCSASRQLDLDLAWRQLTQGILKNSSAADNLQQVLALKQVLLLRPMKRLLAQPHLMAGWLAASMGHYSRRDKRLLFATNPWQLLDELYHYLGMDLADDKPAAACIWAQDDQLMRTAQQFYAELENRLAIDRWPDLSRLLEAGDRPSQFSASLWQQILSSHRGFQAASEILLLLPLIGYQTDFYSLGVAASLADRVPESATDAEAQSDARTVLAPPPPASSNTIVAESGGIFYASESPSLPPLISAGDHFEVGDSMCIIEVMKMFNRQLATFSGTVKKTLIESGQVVKKGQPLFEVTPDKATVVDKTLDLQAIRHHYTESLVSQLIR